MNEEAQAAASKPVETDVQTELIALQADVRGLADSVQKLAGEAPGMAVEAVENKIRRDPIKATAIAAAVGLVFGLVASR